MSHVPPLKHRAEFEAILNDYVIPETSAAELRKFKLVVLSGLAASGRNTVINELVGRGTYHYIVSDTTRPPKIRDGKLEQEGVNYFFRNEDDFLRDLQAGKYLEAELIHNQQVSGTSLREVQRAADMQKIALAELEYKGANNIADATDEATVICLLPPDYDEWMRRLQSREVMSEQEFHNRLQTAKHVLENALQRPTFTFVVNNDVTRAADAIDSLVKNRTRGEEEAETGRDVATQLLKKVEDHLARL